MATTTTRQHWAQIQGDPSVQPNIIRFTIIIITILFTDEFMIHFGLSTYTSANLTLYLKPFNTWLTPSPCYHKYVFQRNVTLDGAKPAGLIVTSCAGITHNQPQDSIFPLKQHKTQHSLISFFGSHSTSPSSAPLAWTPLQSYSLSKQNTQIKSSRRVCSTVAPYSLQRRFSPPHNNSCL